MQKNKIEKIKELLSAERTEAAKQLFESLEDEETVEYLLLKGMIHQKYQEWSMAINTFSKVLESDPVNKEAENNLQMIRNILNFWNPDMFNP